MMFEKEHCAKLHFMPQFSTQLRGLRVPVRRVVPMPGTISKNKKIIELKRRDIKLLTVDRCLTE
jgi:hypothetical protein